MDVPRREAGAFLYMGVSAWLRFHGEAKRTYSLI